MALTITIKTRGSSITKTLLSDGHIEMIALQINKTSESIITPDMVEKIISEQFVDFIDKMIERRDNIAVLDLMTVMLKNAMGK